MSSQELIEEILLDAVRATGLVDVRFATEATKLLRGGEPGRRERRARGPVAGHRSDRDAHRVAALRRRRRRGEPDPQRARDRARGPEGPVAHRQLLLPGRHRAAPRRPQGRAVLRRRTSARAACSSRSTARAAGSARSACAPEEWSLDVFTHERARAWIRAAVGVDGLEPEVLSLGFWKLNATVAERFVQGRVLLCGDAAHQFPPTGGLGVNTGLQGMHNAMWKLACFVLGRAGWPLVETYQTERRDVAQRITSQSLQNSINVLRIIAAAATGARERAHRGAGRRRIAPLRQPPRRRVRRRLPVDRRHRRRHVAAGRRRQLLRLRPVRHAGCRAPHVWLGHPDARLSTLDLFGTAFTLARRTRRRRLVHRRRGGRTRARRPDRSLPHRRRRAPRPRRLRRGVRTRRGRRRARPTRRARRLAQRHADRRSLRSCATPSSTSSLAGRGRPRLDLREQGRES